MRIMTALAASAGSIVVLAGGASAQTTPPALHPRDAIIAKGANGPVADWEEEPWWIALGDCAAAFRVSPEERARVQAFSIAAMKRVSTDRGITPREAGAVVMPYILTGQGHERADTAVGIYGGPDDLRARCEGVMVQFQKAYP